MKILKASDGPLTNFEVLDFLRSRGASKDSTRVMSSLAPFEFKVFDYLVEGAACDQTRESINEFREKSKEYKLMTAEVLNIINMTPPSLVVLSTIVEEWESRLGEDKLEELAEMVVQVLPPPPNQPSSDDAAAMDDSAEANEEENMDADEAAEAT